MFSNGVPLCTNEAYIKSHNNVLYSERGKGGAIQSSSCSHYKEYGYEIFILSAMKFSSFVRLCMGSNASNYNSNISILSKYYYKTPLFN